MYSVLLVVATCFAFCSAEPSWNTFRIRYGINPFASNNFALMPETISDALSGGWNELPGSCEEGGSYGRRFIKGGDVAVILLYDINGFIAGMEEGLLKDEVEKIDTTYDFDLTPYRLDKVHDQEVYFLTVYFVDPAIICAHGRTEKEFEEQGPGTRLYFQKNGGQSLNNTLVAPLYESQTANTPWVAGQCYRSIGTHYFYNMKSDLDCDTFLPFVLVFNRNKLTGFSFLNVGTYYFSHRFEQTDKDSMQEYLPEEVPECFYRTFDKAGGFSFLHVFFSIRPWNLLC